MYFGYIQYLEARVHIFASCGSFLAQQRIACGNWSVPRISLYSHLNNLPLRIEGHSMSVSAPAPIDIIDMLARNAIDVHFQPIVSVRQRTVMGVEALSRGRAGAGTLVPPAALFRRAVEQHRTLELDQACRRAALQRFVPLYRADNKLMLFINTHASTLVEDVQHSHMFANLVQEYGIDPRNIAVEILETDVIDTTLLRAAAETYNRHGFLVAMDDVGAGYSNLDRMLLIKPDILKADRLLVHDLHRDSYKQGVFKTLVQLSERIGGWVVTEGVETREDAMVALGLGADMLQGFFFERPHPLRSVDEFQPTLERVRETAVHFRHYTLEQFTLSQQQVQHRQMLVQQIAAQVALADATSLEQQLQTCITMYPNVASVCVLDATGRQISDTILNPQPVRIQKTIIFQPPAKGTDHSLKEYFYLVAQTAGGVFETQPYVPLPSGRLCVTVSTIFSDVNDQPCVLCVHIDVPEPKHL